MGDQDQFLNDVGGMFFQSTESQADRDAAFEQQLLRTLAAERMQEEALKADSLKQRAKFSQDSTLQAGAIKADSISQNLKFKQDSSMAEQKALQDSLALILTLKHDSTLASEKRQADSINTAALIKARGDNLTTQLSSDSLNTAAGITAGKENLQKQLSSDSLRTQMTIQNQQTIADSANITRRAISKAGNESAEKIATEAADLKRDLLKVTLSAQLASQQGDVASAITDMQIADDMSRYAAIKEKVDRAEMASISAREWSPNIDAIYKNAGDFFHEKGGMLGFGFEEGDLLSGFETVRGMHGSEGTIQGIEQHVQMAKKLPKDNTKRAEVENMLKRFIKRAQNKDFQDGTTMFGDDPDGSRASAVLQTLKSWEYELKNYDLLSDYNVSPEEKTFYDTYDRGRGDRQKLLKSVIEAMNATSAQINPNP